MRPKFMDILGCPSSFAARWPAQTAAWTIAA